MTEHATHYSVELNAELSRTYRLLDVLRKTVATENHGVSLIGIYVTQDLINKLALASLAAFASVLFRLYLFDVSEMGENTVSCNATRLL